LLAGIFNGAPVCGFLPALAARVFLAKVPNLESATLSPARTVAPMTSSVALSTRPTLALVSPVSAATASIKVFLFNPVE